MDPCLFLIVEGFRFIYWMLQSRSDLFLSTVSFQIWMQSRIVMFFLNFESEKRRYMAFSLEVSKIGTQQRLLENPKQKWNHPIIVFPSKSQPWDLRAVDSHRKFGRRSWSRRRRRDSVRQRRAFPPTASLGSSRQSQDAFATRHGRQKESQRWVKSTHRQIKGKSWEFSYNPNEKLLKIQS